MRNLICLLVAIGLYPSTALAGSVNIDFNSYDAVTPASSYGGAAGQTGTWNGLGFFSENSSLVYSGELSGLDGLPSGLGYQVTGISYPSTGTSSDPVLRDSFWSANYAPNPYWSVSLSGFAPGYYDVYIFAPTHPAIPTGSFTVNGNAVDSFGSATSGAGANGINGLDLGIDYIVLTDLYIDGTLAFDQTGYGIYYSAYHNQFLDAYMAGLAGIQVVSAPVPLPSSLLLLAPALISLAGLRRKKC